MNIEKEEYILELEIFHGRIWNYQLWYFGHYHDNRRVTLQFVLLYEDIVPLKFESIFNNTKSHSKNFGIINFFWSKL